MYRTLASRISGATRLDGGMTLAALLLAGLLAGLPARAQTGAQPANSAQSPAQPPAAPSQAPAQVAPSPAPAKAAPSTPAKSAAPPPRNLPNRFAGRAGAYYKVVWGIDSLSVKWTESGEMIRFSWRVLDPERAKVLNDKKIEPSLLDPQRGVGLVVPTMEKIGQLRQSSPPEVGRSYWVAFSNKGRLVKRGDRVNVVIGPFRAEGLVVD